MNRNYYDVSLNNDVPSITRIETQVNCVSIHNLDNGSRFDETGAVITAESVRNRSRNIEKLSNSGLHLFRHLFATEVTRAVTRDNSPSRELRDEPGMLVNSHPQILPVNLLEPHNEFLLSHRHSPNHNLSGNSHDEKGGAR